MIDSNELNPDFTATETMANSDTLHMIVFDHWTEDTKAHVEGYKIQNTQAEKPYYSFGWQTHYSGKNALKLMNHIDELSGATVEDGTFIICGTKDPLEYDWKRKNTLSGLWQGMRMRLEMPSAGLIRLDTDELGAIVWDNGWGDETRNSMAVVTHSDIKSSWLREIYTKTVEEKTKEIVDRNMGKLATALTTFLELPFGEAALDTGFTTGVPNIPQETRTVEFGGVVISDVAPEVAEILNAREKVVKDYCIEKGWDSDDLSNLTIEQIMEIRSLPAWQNPLEQ